MPGSRRVCGELLRDRAEFGSLDAQHYLDSFDAYPAAADREGAAGHPVRRFFAMGFDLLLCAALLDLAGAASMLGVSGRLLLLTFFGNAPAAVLMLVIEPALLHFTGTTPGKFILGISLEREDDSRPTYNEGFARTARVIWRGMGWQIPMFGLVRLGKSCAACAGGRELPWEENGLRLTVRGCAPWRGTVLAALSLCADDINIFTLARSRARLAQFMEERFGHNIESNAAGLSLAGHVETNGSAVPGAAVSDAGPLRFRYEPELTPAARDAKAS